MHSELHSMRQQAHDLVERLTLVQVSALMSLFEPLARPEASLFRAPFCDELPVDAEESAARRSASAIQRSLGQTTTAV